MNAQQGIIRLGQFRQRVYQIFDLRADATMELIDALSGNTTFQSVVGLSLSPYFHRYYSSVSDTICNFFDASSPQHSDEERRQKELGLGTHQLPSYHDFQCVPVKTW